MKHLEQGRAKSRIQTCSAETGVCVKAQEVGHTNRCRNANMLRSLSRLIKWHIFHRVFPAVNTMGPVFAVVLVFVGCCSNVVFLELLVRSVRNLHRVYTNDSWRLYFTNVCVHSLFLDSSLHRCFHWIHTGSEVSFACLSKCLSVTKLPFSSWIILTVVFNGFCFYKSYLIKTFFKLLLTSRS